MKTPREVCLFKWETSNTAGGEFSFEVRARKRSKGLFTLYVRWRHNFRFDEGIPQTIERTRWHKNIRTPEEFFAGIDDCLEHLRDFDFEGSLRDEHLQSIILPEIGGLDPELERQVSNLLSRS